MRQYERITQLNDREVHDLRNAIYGIRKGHFMVWGLNSAKDQRKAPYFHGSYINVLISIFNHSRLGLTLQGFKDYRRATYERKYGWGTRESGIWSVREGIRSNRPDIIERYENLAQLKENEIERLKRDIYGITLGHFNIWGLGGAMVQRAAPYFHGSHINALLAVFPDLNLNPLGFQLDWSSEERGIESVKYALSKEVPHIMEQYEKIVKLSDGEIHELRNRIYGINSGHLNIWGLGRAMNQKSVPYFHGSHINVMMAVFPDLNLNPLGFKLDWSNEERGIESVKYVLSKEVPHIMERYEKIVELSDREIHELRNEIYGITQGNFNVWGLGAAMNQELAPYFHDSHITALITVFPQLNLNPLGFQLDWSSEEKGIESIKYVLSKEAPHIMQQYERIAELSDREIHDLRNEIYGITSGHFQIWGLSVTMDDRKFSYFNGSYIAALLAVFPHPKLGLTREGFVERSENGSSGTTLETETTGTEDSASPLMTEDTSNEAEEHSTLDILEPLVQPQKRFKTWQARAAYYLFVGSWEESFYRWGGLILLPLNLHALGLDLAISSLVGFSISAFGFLFSHTIVRWLVARNSDKWKGWKIEVKNDLFSSKLISTVLLNTIFITAFIFHPISPSLVLLLTIATHSLLDFSKAYRKNRVEEKSVNQEIREVADALNEPEEGLNHLFSESKVTLNFVLNSAFSLWTKESKSPELYIIDLNSSENLENRVALLRTIQQIKDYKKINPTEKIKCVIVKKNGQSIKKLEKISGLKDILFIADSPEETVEKLKVLVKKQSFSIRIVTVPQNSKTWLDLLAQNFKFIELKMMVLQLLDVGRAIRINLSQLGASNSETNEWMEKLIEDGEAEIEGEEAVIKAVPFEPPSKDEELKVRELFNEQA
ncbi:MAG: hypothetical protein A3B80_03500 [Elusimicrobia bacterium RIFCSPHIGHO2_02_FULL_39_36]|nr:MAG: hypothetical protein A3B80_03500 [Elusimicrobia bacterium RIFCSPHIGHO2_02_FULL_39_36]